MKVIQVTKKGNPKFTGFKVEGEEKWSECNSAVRDYLEKNIPCEIDVVDTMHNTVTKIKILSKTNKPVSTGYSKAPQADVRHFVDAGNNLALAVDLFKAGKYKTLPESCSAVAKHFLYLSECCKHEKVFTVEDFPEPEAESAYNEDGTMK